MDPTQGWLSAAEAAERLGVKPATLYAYVSRGVLVRRRAADGHSRFDPADIERLARRGKPRRPAGAAEVIIESRITMLGDDRPYYRGRDALALAADHELEEVARWLWTGEPDAFEPRPPWHAHPEAVAAGRAAQQGLPADVLPLERLQLVVPAIAAADPLRRNVDRAAVMDIGASLVAGMVACLPGEAGAPAGFPGATGAPAGIPGAAGPSAGFSGAAGPSAGFSGAAGPLAGPAVGPVAGPVLGPVAGPSIAQRLWAKLAGRDTPPALADAVRAALVVLADHELAASTLAARVAASVRADAYAAVIAAIGVTSGQLHGGASLGAEAMLAEISDPDRARTVIGNRLRRGERIPGFGHTVYASHDARATLLLDRIRAAVPEHRRLAVADAVLAEAARRRLPAPNVDFALAVLVDVAGMVSGAGEVIFAVARTAGWLAHAMEEYEHRTPLRLRALYVGG